MNKKKLVLKTVVVIILIWIYFILKEFVSLPVNNALTIAQMQDSNLTQSTFNAYQKFKGVADFVVFLITLLVYKPEIKYLINKVKEIK